MTELYSDNWPAPDIAMEAVESGRVINPSRPDARYLILVFQSQKTIRAMAGVQDAVRAQFPSAENVRIASVVDLRGVPRMFRRMAKSALKKAYYGASQELPEGWPAREYVVILPDWKGKFFQAFDVKDADEQAAAVVIDARGIVLGGRQDDDLGPFVLSLLDENPQAGG